LTFISFYNDINEVEKMEVEINGKKYIAKEPTGYQLLKFTEKYMDDSGEVKAGVSKADMIVELISMVFGIPTNEVKELKWSELQALNEKANAYLQGLFEDKRDKKRN